MANQVAARLSGDEYQHLYSWYQVLELKMPRKQVVRVRVEDEEALSVDDVTLRHDADSKFPDRYYQIKYHVDQRGHYSTDSFIEHKPTATSQLNKLFKTWRKLRGEAPHREFEIHFVSNWAWESGDKLKTCFAGQDNALTDDLFAATANMDIGKLRDKWKAHLGATDAEFEAFARTLRFKLGFDCWDEMAQRVAERMDNLRLKSDTPAMHTVAGVVRGWIRTGPKDLTLDVLEEVLQENNLYLPPEEEPSVHVYLVTIKDQRYDIEPDHRLDWRQYFLGRESNKGHELRSPSDWNEVLLPQLEELEARINAETDCRLIRARGQARLSPWFAFGFTFSHVNRYTLELDQYGQHWRTDAEPSPDFALTSNSPDGEVLDGDGKTVAVGISVTGDIGPDVRDHLSAREERIASLLLIRPERDLGKACIRGAGDLVVFADETKKLVRSFVQRWKATKVLLYYFGPLTGAAFIGHQLNAVCQEIQVMENQQPGYSPSFLLRQ